MATYIVCDATTARVLVEEAGEALAWEWLKAYQAEYDMRRMSGLDPTLRERWCALEPSQFLRTHPDSRGIYVRRLS